jgi:hypothetical protein
MDPGASAEGDKDADGAVNGDTVVDGCGYQKVNLPTSPTRDLAAVRYRFVVRSADADVVAQIVPSPAGRERG